MITSQQCEPYDTKSIHAAYVTSSGMDIKWTVYHRFAWEHFLSEGFTEDDVNLVCSYLRKEIRSPKSKLTLACLKFRNLIEDLPAFADHRAMAIASARMPKVDSERASVLRSAGRPETTPDHVQSAAQVIEERLKMAAMLKQYREQSL